MPLQMQLQKKQMPYSSNVWNMDFSDNIKLHLSLLPQS